jgi:hypothetical protein
MDSRFAGDEVSLGLLMEEELIRAAQLEMIALFTLQQEQERMREIMQLRSNGLTGTSPAGLMRGAWVSGAEGVEVYPGGYATSP